MAESQCFPRGFEKECVHSPIDSLVGDANLVEMEASDPPMAMSSMIPLKPHRNPTSISILTEPTRPEANEFAPRTLDEENYISSLWAVVTLSYSLETEIPGLEKLIGKKEDFRDTLQYIKFQQIHPEIQTKQMKAEVANVEIQLEMFNKQKERNNDEIGETLQRLLNKSAEYHKLLEELLVSKPAQASMTHDVSAPLSTSEYDEKKEEKSSAEEKVNLRASSPRFNEKSSTGIN